MITIDKDTLTIVNTEYMSWDNYVCPSYEHIKQEIAYKLKENDLYTGEEADAIKDFINYELTAEDKLGILTDIKEHYETDSHYNDKGLFDETEMIKVILTWIDSKFWTDLYDDYECFL